MTLAARGLARRLAALPPDAPERGPLERALQAVRAGARGAGSFRASELWTWTVEQGALKAVAFGAGATDATESNAVQLWSTLHLAECVP